MSDHPPFETGLRAAPPGWRRTASGDWVMYTPGPLPAQGWKIHVSACANNADRVLEVVWDCCVSRRLAFKFLDSKNTLLARNAFGAPPGRSGKFVTIYPRDDGELESAAEELNERLRGEQGPHIASDLRWGCGPVYVRYGGFLPMRLRMTSGRVVLAVRDGTGRLTPDDRSPLFTLPPWVPVPEFLAPHLKRHSEPVCPPYRIVKALRLWNGGGIYEGEHVTTGERVVLKEARRHAGFATDGTDAVDRLRCEHATLRRLQDISTVPRVLDLLDRSERLFLVLEPVNGTRLDLELGRRNPVLAPDQTDGPFVRWAMGVCRRVEDAIDAMRRRGVVFTGLSQRSVLVSPDGDVVLVGHDQHGTAVDDEALDRFRLGMFLPLNDLCDLAPHKAGELAGVVRGRFSVPRSWLPESRQSPWTTLLAEGWTAVRDALSRAVHGGATTRVDIARGAAGVLYALSVTGAGRLPHLEQWLVEHAAQPSRSARLGFYDGLHGVAYVLDHLGHREIAVRLIERCLVKPREDLGDDLHSGLSGSTLNLIHFAERTGETALLDLATQAGELVADRLSHGHLRAGLLWGASGPALLFLRLYEKTGDTSWLQHAAFALRQDLSHTPPHPTGTGLVLDRYLAHRPDEQFAAASEAIRLAARSWFCARAGLFNGRAGLIYYLAGCAGTRDDLSDQISRLSWHGVPHAGGFAFAGDQLGRPSADLANGTAGVLLALGAAMSDAPVHLPLTAPARAESIACRS